jgi:hypothetical protein
MPDEGASMRDARPEPADADRPKTLPQDHNSRDKVQDKRMPDYEIEQRKEESAAAIERAGGEGSDDGTDQVFPGAKKRGAEEEDAAREATREADDNPSN